MTLTQDAAQIVCSFDNTVFRGTLEPVQAKGIWGDGTVKNCTDCTQTLPWDRTLILKDYSGLDR
jgi:hypothetical protein